MPKAPPKPTASSTRPKRTTTTKQAASTTPLKPTKKPAKTSAKEDGSPSTGFRDSQTAQHTLSSISHRSLTYQHQYVTTLLRRAEKHPHRTPGITAAIGVFKEWKDVKYPAEKAALRFDGFKPLASKEVVTKYLRLMKKTLRKEECKFAVFYVELGKGKKIGNVLVDEGKGEGRDWEVERYEALDGIVPKGKEEKTGWGDGELWSESDEPGREHLRCLAWGWSPVDGRTLAGK